MKCSRIVIFRGVELCGMPFETSACVRLPAFSVIEYADWSPPTIRDAALTADSREIPPSSGFSLSSEISFVKRYRNRVSRCHAQLTSNGIIDFTIAHNLLDSISVRRKMAIFSHSIGDYVQ
ncbi:hypothetical protein CEXT_433511 [Caerostris extrusa]|uniref:Uncharacterized protein n=1 Tax=Caerostris extrusa TaxID=172846 RepID=A0AAV4MF29_CAEEX|nr:hypothetical protein CEXT_433511 [Caerostris extrusa]